jgi:hypothetical protein
MGLEVEALMATLKQFEVQDGSEGNQAGLVDANQ